jgi:alanine racemase
VKDLFLSSFLLLVSPPLFPYIFVLMSEAPAPEARINLDALRANAHAILDKVYPRGLLAVVKWNGYGHGLIECARVLDEIGVAGFGVSSPKEGIELRQAGITQRILVMTDWVGKPPRQFVDWNLEIAATSWYKVELLEAMSRKLGRNIPAHIKFDTGLGRVGIHHSQAAEALTRIAKMSHLKVAAIYSHLGYSGPQDQERGARQIEIFENIVKLAGQLGIHPEWIHLANSAAAMAIPDVPGNLVRTGIALYGQPPSPEVRALLPLEPVMTLVGHVTKVRRLRRGHGFPSAHFWTAPMDGWGAEVNLGFGVSYPRSLAGKAHVLLNGRRCPLVGVIARDTSYVFTREKPEIGDEVVFWGRQGDETLYLYEVASLINALPYELPTWLSPRLPRVFVNSTNAMTRAA